MSYVNIKRKQNYTHLKYNLSNPNSGFNESVMKKKQVFTFYDTK